MKENVAAIIPAKGHSNRLPNKNVKPLCGYPLFYYSVKAAKLASSLTGVYVSTESDEIANLGASYGAEIIRRPQELCDDSVPNFRVIQHAVEWIEDQQGYSVDILILLQPTNPFRTPQMINKAIEEMRGSPEADSMVSVRKSREIFGELGEEFWTPYEKQLPHRLSNSKILHVLTGHLFMFRTARTLKNDCFLGSNIKPFVLDDGWVDIDIDYPDDFLLAEFYLNRRKETYRYFFEE